jgi:hypothetical protein
MTDLSGPTSGDWFARPLILWANTSRAIDGMISLGFIRDGKLERFLMPLASARHLCGSIADMLDQPEIFSHSDKSRGNPMREESSPSGSELVWPPIKSSSAAAAE